MKKMLIIFSSVVLLFSLLIVPASAAEAEYYDVDFYAGQNFSASGVPAGRYSVVMVLPAEDLTFELSSDFEVVLNAECRHIAYIEYAGASYYVQFCPGDTPDFSMVDVLTNEGRPLDADGYLRFTPVSAEEPPKRNETVIAVSVFDVFAGVGSWILTSLGSVSGLFWNASAGQLTILGVLAVAALGVGIILGLVFIISRFLRFRS